MVENITVVVLAVIVFAAGIWSWWFTNSDNDPPLPKEKENADE